MLSNKSTTFPDKFSSMTLPLTLISLENCTGISMCLRYNSSQFTLSNMEEEAPAPLIYKDPLTILNRLLRRVVGIFETSIPDNRKDLNDFEPSMIIFTRQHTLPDTMNKSTSSQLTLVVCVELY